VKNLLNEETGVCLNWPGNLRNPKNAVSKVPWGKRVENVKVAETLLKSFPCMRIVIREHVVTHNVNNPEYEIKHPYSME
jgi:hypothetical protein